MENVDQKLIAIREADTSFPARSAVAYFLFMIMPADGYTHPKEMARLERILADDFDLDATATHALIEHAEAQKLSGHDMAELAKLLLSELEPDELLKLISHMWEMVFADDRMHEIEVLLVERVASLLKIDREAVSAAMTN